MAREIMNASVEHLIINDEKIFSSSLFHLHKNDKASLYVFALDDCRHCVKFQRFPFESTVNFLAEHRLIANFIISTEFSLHIFRFHGSMDDK